ncbi:hypothetical protein [Burkholderia anthina]|uniref:hypothetical protein n=1 Tax=Burkholderia anthina TaxID=179879 RepID=UPI00158D2354|nr:hypothetical protein [Burkholderia anthina]
MSFFNQPSRKTLDDHPVDIALLSWSQFNDAIAIGGWMQQLPDMMPTIADLMQLNEDGDLRGAIDRIISGCIALPNIGEPIAEDASTRSLSVADVQAMPIMTILEAILLIMEVNLDFFLQSLQTCMAIRNRIVSTGSPLLNSSSAPATTAPSSADTPSAS